MNDEELKKIDWQLFTMKSHFISVGYLKAILNAQARIIAKLDERKLTDIKKELYEDKSKEVNNFIEKVKKSKGIFPDYS